jgi:hypothetical protein
MKYTLTPLVLEIETVILFPELRVSERKYLYIMVVRNGTGYQHILGS